jgi:serine/threonine-protein kinase RsbT
MAARQMGTQFATRLGFSPSEITLIAAIISELARIIIVGAEAGHLTFTVLENGARRGLEVVAQQGAAPPSTSNISGRQLADVGKLMDEFTIVSEQGNGTTVTLKKWLVNGR